MKAVIFDLYGVLGLNTWQTFKRTHFGHRPKDWEHLRGLGQRVDAGKAQESELVEAVAHETGESTVTVRAQFEQTRPNVELLAYITTKLQGVYKLALLSNASRDVVGAIFTPSEQALFDVVVSSYHVGLTKPDPKIFLLTAERLGLKPSECLFIDDQPRHLAAAQALGFETIHYKSVEQVTRAIDEVLNHD